MHRESDMARNRPANFSTATLQHLLSRRSALRQLGLAGLAFSTAPAFAEDIIKLPLPSDPRERPLTRDFPQKGTMILQRTRPPLLETPLDVFDRGVFTPNNQFFVRWHWAVIPTSIDVAS